MMSPYPQRSFSCTGRFAQCFFTSPQTAKGTWLCAASLCNLSVNSNTDGRLVATVYVTGKPHLRVSLLPSTTHLVLLDPKTTGSTWVLWVDAIVTDGINASNGAEDMEVEVVPSRARFAWRFEQDDAATQCQQLLQAHFGIDKPSSKPSSNTPCVITTPAINTMAAAPDVVMSNGGEPETNIADRTNITGSPAATDPTPPATLPPNLQRAVELYMQDPEFAVFIDRALVMWDEEEEDHVYM